jgi:hypothetical protein
MSSEFAWNQVKEELNRLSTDQEYKLFRGSLEKLHNLSNARVGGEMVVSGDEARNALDLIKGMQREVKSGANPREVFERVLSESAHPLEKLKSEGGSDVLAGRDVYNAGGDLNQAQRDVIKAGGNVYMFNIHWLLSESYKEIKRGSDQIMIQVVLLVMTDKEAAQLDSDEIFEAFQNPTYSRQFNLLQERLTEARIENALRSYGPTPEDWRPFPAEQTKVSQVIANALKMVPGFNKPIAPDFRDIRELAYGVDEQKSRTSLKLLRDEGCMVIMDAISMQHPLIQRAYRRSLLDVYTNIPVLRVAPTHSVLRIEQQMLNFSDKYEDLEIYKRLNWDYDDSCREVSDAGGLGRWITGRVPKVLQRREDFKQAQTNAQTAYKDANGAAS